MPLIYHYHPETFLYQHSEEADESPLEPGVYLLPAAATWDEPPQSETGKVLKYLDGTWTQSDPDPEPEGNTADDELPTPSEMLTAARNGLLRRSDWTVLPDSPLSEDKQTEWKTYRQKLRDLPGVQVAANRELTNIVWPVPPS
tara:strand:- start:3435 stop:3863 length:429 start_codon:yes stop_codon:yes gene_type:complete